MKPRVLLVVLLAVGCLVGVASPAHADGGDPIGTFEATSVRLSGVFYYGLSTWQIAGWAADPDAPGQVLSLHVYVDGQKYADDVHTGDSRPDVAAAVPFAGPNAGWSRIVTATTGAPHTVCVYAINVGAGTENTTLGCKDIPEFGPNPGDPRGVLEEATPTPGLVRFSGWAGDPDGDATDPPVVRPFIDGQPYLSLRATLPRPDVRAANPDLGNAAAFNDVIAVLPGPHIYCVDVGNDGHNGANNTSLGCGLIVVPDREPSGPDPGGFEGSWDSYTFENVHPDGTHGSTTCEGWAWSPGTPPPATVRMRDVWTGFTVGFVRWQSVGDYTTDQPRPDVQQVFPDAPPDTGWKVSFSYEGITTARTPTDLYRCFYVVQGANERLLGCSPLVTRTT